jgi:glutathione reductase (NADPH)
MEHFDFIALGGGNAGLAASKQIRTAGRKVALIDPTPIGGLCSLKGCNPKKVVVRATEVVQGIKDAAEHGVRTGPISIDWNAVIDRKHRFTDPVTARTEHGLQDAGIAYIKAPPRFVAPDRLEVDGRTLSFEGALIATGSAPRRLSVPGAEHVATTDAILELRQVPNTLAIIGAGVVAFEFGQVFARLGSAVHLLMHGQRALPRFDQEIVAKLVEHSRSLGIVFHQGVEVQRIETQEARFALFLNTGETLTADFILNAAGRPPNIMDLDLEAAGVDYRPQGVAVNEYLRNTRNSRIFAAGDARGEKQLSPVASYEGALVAANFLHGDRTKVDLASVPSAVYTVPPLAMVGMSEDEARQRGLAIEVTHEDMSDWTVVNIAHIKPAHGKVISDKTTGRILGACLYSHAAEDNIQIFAMAMRFGITRAQLAEMVYAYPTFAGTLGYLTPSASAMQ